MSNKAKIMIYDLHETFTEVMLLLLKSYSNIGVQWYNSMDIAEEAANSIGYDWIIIATYRDCQHLIDRVRQSQLNPQTPISIILPANMDEPMPKIDQDPLSRFQLLYHPADLAVILDEFAHPYLNEKKSA